MPPASGLLERLWVLAATHLWQTTLVLCVIFAVARLMRDAPARFLNALYWLGLAKLLLPLPLLGPLVERPVGLALRALAPDGLGADAAWVESTAVLLDPGRIAIATERAASGGTVPMILTSLWLAGALGLCFVWLRSGRNLLEEGRDRDCGASGEAIARLRSALAFAGIPRDAVVLSERPTVPYVTGLVRPRIVLPVRLVEELGGRELRSILLHEDAHRRRFDPARALVARVATLAFFFYPLLWTLLRRIRETGEMACDEAALIRGAGPETFAGAISRTLELELDAAPSSAVFDRRSPSLIRRRLKRLQEPWRCVMKSGHRAALAVAVMCVLLTSTLSLSALADGASTDAKAPPPPPKPPTVAKPVQHRQPVDELFISKMVPPEYPEVAREANLEAVVLLELTLADDLSVATAEVKAVVVGHAPLGAVRFTEEAKFEEEEGMDVYHDDFTEPAIEAALQWEIEVRPEGAEPPSETIVVPVQFRLDGDKDEKEEETEGTGTGNRAPQKG